MMNNINELSNGNKKVIAFYLPQFHSIPENDLAWGEGFTEWTNVRKAMPLYKWHYQPRVPLDKDYYNLLDVNVMVKQAELAKKYGLFGFCYYHYWFKDGKKLLEKPIEQMLDNRNVDIPFCLCWANENWTRNWDGGNREIIVEQDYGNEDDWEKHFLYLLRFFNDERYIRFQGKPLLLIYKPELIDKFDEMVAYWRKRAQQEGFLGINIVSQFPEYFFNGEKLCERSVDAFVKFEPVFSSYCYIKNMEKYDLNSTKGFIKAALKKIGALETTVKLYNFIRWGTTERKKVSIFDYDEQWKIILEDEPYWENLINGAYVDWDNTPRNRNGRIYKGASPDNFEKYMTELFKKPTAMNSVFINAWNEWAEGAYLEPDEKYGYGYLKALKKAIDNCKG